MDTDDLCFAGAARQAELVAGRAVTAVELVQVTLDRIADVDPRINSFRTVLGERALSEAAQADEQLALGNALPMLGVPVAVKDTIAVEGEVTTFGTGCNAIAAAVDSPLVARLREAGAVIIGITTCSELAVWPITETPTWGATRNPWNTEHSPGGSSGGSGAAVAAGLCGLAVGSDGLGSIRVPASFNGVFGLKPQRDRVWHGSADWKGLSVNGPLTRTVADAALFLDAAATAGPASGFLAAAVPGGPRLRIAIAWKSLVEWPVMARLGDAQRRAVDETAGVLRDLGHTVVEQEIDFPRRAANDGMIRYLAGVHESQAVLEKPELLSPQTARMVSLGGRIPKRIVRSAMDAVAACADQINELFTHVDVVLTPGALQDPLKIGELDGAGALRRLNQSGRIIPHYSPWNVIGQPAASVPAGFSETGLPVSVQLAGRPSDEETLLRLAAEIETVKPWFEERPGCV